VVSKIVASGPGVKLARLTANEKGLAATSTSKAGVVDAPAAAGCSTTFLKIERGTSHRPGAEILTRRIVSETCSKATEAPSRSGPSVAPCVVAAGASEAERTVPPLLPSGEEETASVPGTICQVEAQRPQVSSQKPANSGLEQLPHRVCGSFFFFFFHRERERAKKSERRC